LAGAAMAIAVCIGVPLGVAAATRRNSIWDNLLMLAGLLGQSLPVFWLGLLMIMIFAVGLGWFPVAGTGGPQHLILPALTLGLFSTAYIARMTRSSMLEVLGREFVRTAHAKGLALRNVVLKHALRNALIPLITVIGLQFGALLGGAVIVEQIFGVPGLGTALISSISERDYPVVQSMTLVIAVVFVVTNLLVDLSYAWLDPRVRYR